MNEYFVNIKVDREERPDVDRMYMTFLQVSNFFVALISGSSPLTSRLLQVVEDGQCQYVRCMKHGSKLMEIVMTPTLEPFFAGTYFPRQRFKSVLSKIADMWEDDREQCESMGSNVIAQLKEMSGSVS